MSDEKPSIAELQADIGDEASEARDRALPALLEIAQAAALVLETHDSCCDLKADIWLRACSNARTALRSALAKVRP